MNEGILLLYEDMETTFQIGCCNNLRQEVSGFPNEDHV